MPDGEMKVGIPYTMPLEGTNYTKGSAHWLRTNARELNWTCGHSVYLFGPEYEVIERDGGRPWQAHPILYKTPDTFSARLHAKPPAEGTWDVQFPIFGFTRGPNYALTSESTPSQFRAIVEILRWYMDFTPVLHGFDHWDVLWIQHMSWNMIAGAHYAVQGKAVAISHETCARCDSNTGEGGWAAANLRDHILHAVDNERGLTPVIAISKQVKGMLTAMPSGMMLTDRTLFIKMPDGTVMEQERIPIIPNFYDDRVYHPIPGMTKQRLLEEFSELAAHYRHAADAHGVKKQYAAYVPFDGISDEGKWAVFVGRAEEFKGIEQLIRTWAKYIRGKDATGDAKDTLIVIGPGLDADSRFAAYAEELGVAKHIAFVGPQEPEDINKIYNAGDLGIMISLHEGDGVVVKQPGGTARRVVAPDSGGPAEYMEPVMGQKVKSRDPERVESMQRGIELLGSERNISWGALHLSGPDILRHYRVWREHYESGTKDPVKLAAYAARNERIEKLANGWESGDAYVSDVRSLAIAFLTAYMDRTARPSIPPVFDADVDIMVEVFKTMGGMDVEVDDFVRAYDEELARDPEEQRRLGAQAYDYVKSTFAATSHAMRINEFFEIAASRPWFAGAYQADPAVYSAYQVYADVAAAFDAWRAVQQGSDEPSLAHAVADFHQKVVARLFEVSQGSQTWPSHRELGLRDPLRSSRIAAQFSGVTLGEYENLRAGLAERVATSATLESDINGAMLARYDVMPAAAAMASAVASMGFAVK